MSHRTTTPASCQIAIPQVRIYTLQVLAVNTCERSLLYIASSDYCSLLYIASSDLFASFFDYSFRYYSLVSLLFAGCRMQLHGARDAWQVWYEMCPKSGLVVGLHPGQCCCENSSNFRSHWCRFGSDDHDFTCVATAKVAAIAWAHAQHTVHRIDVL
jgi:hypothetical protein